MFKPSKIYELKVFHNILNKLKLIFKNKIQILINTSKKILVKSLEFRKYTQNNPKTSILKSGAPFCWKKSDKRIRFQQADKKLFNLVSNFNENDNLLEYPPGIQYNFSID